MFMAGFEFIDVRLLEVKACCWRYCYGAKSWS